MLLKSFKRAAAVFPSYAARVRGEAGKLRKLSNHTSKLLLFVMSYKTIVKKIIAVLEAVTE